MTSITQHDVVTDIDATTAAQRLQDAAREYAEAYRLFFDQLKDARLEEFSDADKRLSVAEDSLCYAARVLAGVA